MCLKEPLNQLLSVGIWRALLTSPETTDPFNTVGELCCLPGTRKITPVSS
jgi:hypothetical protein